jgi:glutamyl-tRNA reductase
MLDQLGLVGVTWRQEGSEALAEFTLRRGQADEGLKGLARELHLEELAYLATCNRVELLFVRSSRTPAGDLRRQAFTFLAGRDPLPGESERRLEAWRGERAAEHVFLTAAGLDSACLGETEIVAQMRGCRAHAVGLGLWGQTLGLVFEEALRIAARVRGRTSLGRGRVSLAEIAVDLVRERVASTPGRVALVGVSPMTERAARSLGRAGIQLLVVNRTVEKAAALAARFQAEHVSLEAFVTEPPPIEALLSATGSDRPVLAGTALERLAARTPSGQTPLLIDMAVPADIDPMACRSLGMTRVGMDDIVRRAEGNRTARRIETARAQAQVREALPELRERFAERFYGPLFGALQRHYRRTAQEGVKRLLRRELRTLGSEERAAIETWASMLARRFAHVPCVGLRGLLRAGSDGSIEAFLEALEPELAAELRAALPARPTGAQPVAAAAGADRQERPEGPQSKPGGSRRRLAV